MTASYVPAWTGGAIISGWVVLSCLLPFFLFRPISMGWGHWLGLTFLTYATIALWWAPVPIQGVWDLWQLWLLGFAFCLGASAASHEIKRLWVGMALGLSVCLGFAIAQWFGYNPIFANNFGAYAGAYVNPDMFGETACLLTIALIAARTYWPLLLTLPPIYLTQSRTVYVAYSAVIAFALWERFRWWAVVPCLLVMLGASWYVTLKHKDSIAERYAIWADTYSGLTWRGRGPGSFYMLYPAFAKRTDTMNTRPEDPHNEFLNLAFNYGLGAIPILALLALGMLSSGPERYVVLAFIAIAAFSFPTRIPTEGFVGMVALGRLCARGRVAWLDELGRRPRAALRALRARGTARALEQVHSYGSGV